MPVLVEQQGAWSSQGRRSTQEDAILLTEVHDTRERSILLAGVFDGHLGTAASSFIKHEFPTFFLDELIQADTKKTTAQMLEQAWDLTCQSYRAQCNDSDLECIAEYDPREGVLKANTASENTIAGSTAVLVALDKGSGHISILNCGDSRASVVDASTGKPVFSSVDHKPESDSQRLEEGIALGKDYSLPQCRLSRWFLPIGEYEFAVSRSLEGPFVTSKGIVSDADLTDVSVEPGMSILLASDGLWEVIDTAEACQVLHRLRGMNTSAGDAAKTLSSMALQKGTSDNVSAIVVFLS